MGTAPNPVEPGYTTTEFWVTLVTALLGVLTAFNVIHFTNAQTQVVVGFSALVIPAVAYIISRGVRKKSS